MRYLEKAKLKKEAYKIAGYEVGEIVEGDGCATFITVKDETRKHTFTSNKVGIEIVPEGTVLEKPKSEPKSEPKVQKAPEPKVEEAPKASEPEEVENKEQSVSADAETPTLEQFETPKPAAKKRVAKKKVAPRKKRVAKKKVAPKKKEEQKSQLSIVEKEIKE